MKTKPNPQVITRRNFLRLAGAASIAAVLASCAKATEEAETEQPAEAPGEAPATPEPITIRYGRHDAVDGDIENVKTFQEKYPNVKVEQEQVGDFLTKIPDLAAAGTLPDVVRSWEAMVLDMGRNNQFIDLQPYVEATANFNPQDFYENWWNYPIVDGNRMGIPDAVAPHITYYNRKLFDEKGVEYPNKDSFTWDDFEQKAGKISDPENKVWGSETIPIGWTYFTLKQVWQNGGDIYSPDYKSCVIDQPPAVEVIQYWADLLLDGNIMPSPNQIAGIAGEGVAAELFSAGAIGIQRMGAWITQVCIDAGFQRRERWLHHQ